MQSALFSARGWMRWRSGTSSLKNERSKISDQPFIALLGPPDGARTRSKAARAIRTASSAQRFDQGFFLFFREMRQSVERGEITTHSRRGEKGERFGGEPRISRPAP